MAISATAATSAATQLNGVGLQDFLKILTSQLSNQDPLKPLDNQEFIAQVAQFASLEQNRQLNQKIDQLLSVQAATQSVGLLGKTVEVNSSEGLVTGQVMAFALSAGEPLMTIQTASGAHIDGVSLAQLVSVR
jgi:flagellar basal-body rod modification protein FlgD